MISAFGIDHARGAAVEPMPSAVVKTYLGEGVYKPVSELPKASVRARRNALLARKAGTKERVARELPKRFYRPGIGQMRVTGYHGKGLFEGVDSKDVRRVFRRDQGYFGKAAPKNVPDSLSVVLPGSTVRAYDNSARHKGEAGAKNLTAKLGAGAAGFGIGAALGGVAARRLKPLRSASKVVVGRKSIMISADQKRGWAQSTAGGALGGAAGSVAGNVSLKRIKDNPRYGYRR